MHTQKREKENFEIAAFALQEKPKKCSLKEHCHICLLNYFAYKIPHINSLLKISLEFTARALPFWNMVVTHSMGWCALLKGGFDTILGHLWSPFHHSLPVTNTPITDAHLPPFSEILHTSCTYRAAVTHCGSLYPSHSAPPFHTPTEI